MMIVILSLLRHQNDTCITIRKRWDMNKSTTMESENVLLHLSETFMGKWYDYETVLIEIIKKC